MVWWAMKRLRAGWARLRDERGEGPASYLGTMIVVFVALLAIAAALGGSGISWDRAAGAIADKIGEAIESMSFTK